MVKVRLFPKVNLFLQPQSNPFPQLHTQEIITLQFGSAANYAGSHFWNFQVTLWELFGKGWHRLSTGRKLQTLVCGRRKWYRGWRTNPGAKSSWFQLFIPSWRNWNSEPSRMSGMLLLFPRLQGYTTATPRLMIYDIKGSLGSLRQVNKNCLSFANYRIGCTHVVRRAGICITKTNTATLRSRCPHESPTPKACASQ